MTARVELAEEIRELRGELRDLLGELQGALGRLDHLAERSAEPPASEPPRPILGTRQASEVLGVGREQIRRVLGELGPRDPRRPTYVASRGGKRAAWWPSAEACRTWWAEVHGNPSGPAAPRRKRARQRERPQPSRSLAERLKALEG